MDIKTTFTIFIWDGPKKYQVHFIFTYVVNYSQSKLPPVLAFIYIQIDFLASQQFIFKIYFSKTLLNQLFSRLRIFSVHRQTDRRTDRQTDRQTDQWTDLLIETPRPEFKKVMK